MAVHMKKNTTISLGRFAAEQFGTYLRQPRKREPGGQTAIVLAKKNKKILGKLSVDMDEIADGVRRRARKNRSKATLLAYAHQFKLFTMWCKELSVSKGEDVPFLPTKSAIVAGYMQVMSTTGRSVSTMDQALAAIAYVHNKARLTWNDEPESLKEVREGIRRDVLVAPEKKAPIDDVRLWDVIATCGNDAAGVRDKALLLVGWMGALRRSEIVALDVSDVTFEETGLRIVLRKSKTDQEGRGAERGLDGSEVLDALLAWIRLSGIKDGPLFRGLRYGDIGGRLSASTVALIVKSRIYKAGYDPTEFSGHSLRSGFVTTAARGDRRFDQIMKQTGHKRADTLMGYIRHENIFKENASTGLFVPRIRTRTLPPPLPQTARQISEDRTSGDQIEPEVRSDGRGDGAREYRYCWYCGTVLRVVEPCSSARVDREIEHMIPVCKRGSDDASNLVSSCVTCNLSKSRMDVEEYRDKCSSEYGSIVVFAGECNLYVESGPGFSYLTTLSLVDRDRFLQESRDKMAWDTP